MSSRTILFLVFIFLVWLLPSINALAAVYECRTSEGKRTFKDKPCAGAEKGNIKKLRVIKPSEAERDASAYRAALNEAKAKVATDRAHAENEEAGRKKKAIRAEKARQCKSAKDDMQYWETHAKHAYSKSNWRYYKERADQAKAKVKVNCGA